MKNTHLLISDTLKDLGISPKYMGYSYLKTAIELVMDDVSLAHSVTKVLYPTVAKEHKTTSSRVERAVRHAIEIAFYRGDIDKLKDIFGFSVSCDKGKATNSEFIATIADYLSTHTDVEETNWRKKI